MTTNQLKYWENQEAIRANQAKERETRRADLAKEKETQRSNVTKEVETERANKAQEAQKRKEWATGLGFNLFDRMYNAINDPADRVVKLFSGIGKLFK